MNRSWLPAALAAAAAPVLLAMGGPAVRAAASRPAVEMPAPLPSLREQDRIRQEWLKARIERVLPPLMRRHGVAMWIVACREYNEDPVFFSLVSPSVMAAGRRAILVFNDLRAEKGWSGRPAITWSVKFESAGISPLDTSGGGSDIGR